MQELENMRESSKTSRRRRFEELSVCSCLLLPSVWSGLCSRMLAMTFALRMKLHYSNSFMFGLTISPKVSALFDLF